ncbi:hypothetical protein DPMN_131800 [Dreissena polymorpha]|uniref:Uncharacterized protein n=1 Tax=Dreissena polymorpha TaxID=45954 RepID=A0A9D4FX46_DREPO|nr:hypothetical protein DPMN_131800 [Dreissena polymorpha]
MFSLLRVAEVIALINKRLTDAVQDVSSDCKHLTCTSIVIGQTARGAPGLVMGPCIVEIDCIVIREVPYQLEENRCRNEEGGCGLCGRGSPGLVMGLCIVEIDRIVIRIIQYQLEVNRCKNEEIIVKCNFGWVVGNWAMHINRCRNEEVIVKGNFGWVWPMWVGRLRVGNGAMHIEIDRIVIIAFQYQFEVNRCKNEEIIVKGNFGWVWSMWAMRPRIDRIVIREVQYQFEENRCRNEEVTFQGSSAYRRKDRRTDGRRR